MDPIMGTVIPAMGGYRRRWSFANGYGASVIRNQYSYGGDKGLYELAVLCGEELCYSTDITSDVEGWLTPREVAVLLKRIEALDAAE